MINITDEEYKKLCEERTKYPIRYITREEIELFDLQSFEAFQKNNLLFPIVDNLLAKKISDNENEFWYIGNHSFVSKPNIPLHNEWEIQEIYQLGYYFDDIYLKDGIATKSPELDYYLYRFSKQPTEEVILGFNHERDEDYWLNQCFFSNQFEKKYGFNSSDINNEIDFINKDSYCEDHPTLRKREVKLPQNLEIVSIPRKNFYIKYLKFLSRYRKEITDVLGLPDDNEKFDSLDSFVTFIEPDEEKGYSNVKDGVYVTPNNIGILSDKIVHWIGSMGNHSVSVANTNESEEVLAIFQCDDKELQKYLLFYLSPENRIGIDFNDYGYCPFGKSYKKFEDPQMFNRENIKHFPVVIPSGDLSKYQGYVTPSHIQKNLLLNTISDSAHDKKIKEIMREDMEEVVTCYEHGAYKAAIVLTGSLLEAFLFDWLYELEGQDFYDKGKYHVISNYGGVIGRTASNLDEYIKALQEKYPLEEPPWDKDDGPNKIREKRNYIHPKKFFNTDKNVINETACKEVYTYLEYIVKWRFDHVK